MKPGLLLRVAAPVTVLAAAAAAFATVVVRADVDRLAELADAVVDGKVEKRAVAVEDGGSTIWTTYEIAVGETWLGTEHERIVVHVPGGEAGGVVQEVSGTARLAVGQRTVLFLDREDGRWLVLGEAQGCFRVEPGADGETLICTNAVEGLALVDEDGAQVDAEPTRLRHAALKRRVTGVARRREEAERLRREALAQRLEELRKSAERNAERTRGKPGGAQ